MSTFLIILAAGNSKRLGSTLPKPYHEIYGRTILEHSLLAFKDFKEIKKTFIVYNKKHQKFLNKLKISKVNKITGGRNRQQSVFNALKIIRKNNCSKIIIHDAARPNPSKKLIKNLLDKLKKNHVVVPVVKPYDAVKRVKNNLIFKNIKRDSLRFSQTPQGFSFNKIYQNHKKNINQAFDDDSALFINNKEKVFTINGDKKNFKITDKEDIKIFKSLINKKTYFGIGFDIHKLVNNRKLYLGGIKIPFKHGLIGHSDGDPVIHALIDSLLGACKLGDIGKLFSDKNKKYKNIRSTIMLKKVLSLIESKNFFINNIDINIIAQKPKIKKYTKKMTTTICNLCKIKSNQINIKGKTTEKLGLIGKEKAIASEVIVSVNKYD